MKNYPEKRLVEYGAIFIATSLAVIHPMFVALLVGMLIANIHQNN
jgi:hypothetical protein